MSIGLRYHVVSKIAHGGMAEIFLATQVGAEGFQKQVVLKRILPALSADPSFVRMLVDEAHIASTLSHSNLVQVLDLGKADGQFFLALEFIDGWSLEQVRRRAQKARIKFPLPLALHVTSSLCRALAYVHTRRRNGRPLGIVHRDVTPQNVLLSREGEVKLADFGIAKAAGKREKSVTGVIKGKFAYMSPEQSLGLDLDARSDLFSVGTVLYLLTTGRKPFEGTTDLDVLMHVRKARYEKPSIRVKDFNPEVERFIARALRVDRARRWQSAEQMADRLDAILLKLGQTAGAAGLKRWLEYLQSKDGAKPPAENATIALDRETIQLSSQDLQLEEVSVSSTETRNDVFPQVEDPPTGESLTRQLAPHSAAPNDQAAQRPPEHHSDNLGPRTPKPHPAAILESREDNGDWGEEEAYDEIELEIPTSTTHAAANADESDLIAGAPTRQISPEQPRAESTWGKRTTDEGGPAAGTSMPVIRAKVPDRAATVEPPISVDRVPVDPASPSTHATSTIHRDRLPPDTSHSQSQVARAQSQVVYLPSEVDSATDGEETERVTGGASSRRTRRGGWGRLVGFVTVAAAVLFAGVGSWLYFGDGLRLDPWPRSQWPSGRPSSPHLAGDSSTATSWFFRPLIALWNKLPAPRHDSDFDSGGETDWGGDPRTAH